MMKSRRHGINEAHRTDDQPQHSRVTAAANTAATTLLPHRLQRLADTTALPQAQRRFHCRTYAVLPHYTDRGEEITQILMSDYGQNGSDWPKMGQIRTIFQTFLLTL